MKNAKEMEMENAMENEMENVMENVMEMEMEMQWVIHHPLIRSNCHFQQLLPEPRLCLDSD
jgi:hypothetical protein